MDHSAEFQMLVDGMTVLVAEHGENEPLILERGAILLAALVENDRWLPREYQLPGDRDYQQYLLYCDPLDRFSVVSFVWGPGQKTPLHNHTVWGLIGMLRGEERGERFELAEPGRAMRRTSENVLCAGEVDQVSPSIGDNHRVENALTDRVSISIHVYGGNIGKITRQVFNPEDGSSKPFVSGYSVPRVDG